MPRSRRRPNYVQLWSQRLRPYSDDAEIFTQDPFAQVFTDCLNIWMNTRGHDIGLYLLDHLESALEKNFYVIHLDDWLTYTLGASIVEHMPTEAIRESRLLFLNVLFARFQFQGSREGEERAYDLLGAAQIANFHQYYRTFDETDLPADFSLDADIEQRQTADNDTECTDNDSAWEDSELGDSDYEELEDPMDTDYIDEDPVSSSDSGEPDDNEPDEGSDMEVSEPAPTHLPSFVDDPPRIRTLPAQAAVPPVIHADKLPFIWVRNLRDFFFDNTDAEELNSAAVVNDLVAMRELKEASYTTSLFQMALQASGLFEAMREVARPGNLLDTLHRDIEQSFRWHDWRISYAELIYNWVKPTVTQEEYDATLPQPDPEFQFTKGDALDLLEFIIQHPRMQPWTSNPTAVYLFLSKYTFQANCDLWLIPCLRTLGYRKIKGFNPEIVYRRLMDLPLFGVDQTSLNAQHAFMAATQEQDCRLAVIISETAAYRAFMKQVKTDLYRPVSKRSSAKPRGVQAKEDVAGPSTSRHPIPQNTRRPVNEKRRRNRSNNTSVAIETKVKVLGSAGSRRSKKQANRCVRKYYVKRRKGKRLIGAALTCAPEHDRVLPKPQSKPKNGSTPKPLPPVEYYHPFKDLQMKLVHFREDVYERCGQDIVGGVRYKPFSEDTVTRLLHDHRLVKSRALRRRAMLQRWAYGTMTGGGSRPPMGGRRGDVYGPYAAHLGDTPDDIRAMFREAVANALIEVGNTVNPGMKREISELTQETGLNLLGRTGIVNFTCTNYISCDHDDKDAGLQDAREQRAKKDCAGGLRPCAQLEKSNCGPHDYNFSYTRWAVVVRTMANMVWNFNGDHDHGTVMPARSAMQKAKSLGKHPTTPAASVIRAQRIRQIRCGYNLRPRV
ncbi:hypothetical protein C8R47DRAFT_1071989 [Mycena vitilis]|nr:hypothetical protein C8R47DRAFT_1071989 [Mycena vitilis]